MRDYPALPEAAAKIAVPEGGAVFSARVSSYLIFDLLFFNLFTVVFRLPHGAVKIMANVLVAA